MAPSPIAIIAGVGPGTGAAVARRFAQTYPVVLLARSASNYEPVVDEINKSGGKAVGISADITDEESVNGAFDQIKKQGGLWKDGGDGFGVAAAVFNLGGGFAKKPFLELTKEEFESGWKSNGYVRPFFSSSFFLSFFSFFSFSLILIYSLLLLCGLNNRTNRIGAYLFSRSVLPLLLATGSAQSTPKYPPTLIFTGATASVRGSANFSAFATGKFALRALSQSLAREFGPKGVHVAHAIIDGVIDIPRTKGYVFKDEDAKIGPDAVSAINPPPSSSIFSPVSY